MKKLFIYILCAGSFFGAKAASNNDTIVEFRVSPALHCANCEAKIKKQLKFEKGILDINAKAPSKTIKVKYDKRKIDAAKIEQSLSKAGYKAQPADK